MKIGLYSNLTKDTNAIVTKTVFSLIKERGFDVYLSRELQEVDFGVTKLEFYDNPELARLSDYVVVLGGDGTILRIAEECARFDTPIYAINIGTKGFLSEVNKEEFEKIVGDVEGYNYILDKRKFLKVKIKGSSEEFYALNDVVVCQSQCSKVLRAEINVDDTLVDKYTSDGIIVATPTGSTAYSLSAGGPIVAPDVDCFIISPICAHSLHSRPMIVSNSSKVCLKISDKNVKAAINVDGVKVQEVNSDDIVEITDSNLYVSFVRRNSYNFYEKLLAKMRYWSSIEV